MVTIGCFNIGGQHGGGMVSDASNNGVGSVVLCDASSNIRGVVLNLRG